MIKNLLIFYNFLFIVDDAEDVIKNETNYFINIFKKITDNMQNAIKSLSRDLMTCNPEEYKEFGKRTKFFNFLHIFRHDHPMYAVHR